MTVINNPEGLPDGWTDVGAVVMVGRERTVAGKNTSSAHFYLTSLRLGRTSWAVSFGAIGAWRTGCTGASTSRSRRMTTGPGTPTPVRTWASSDVWRCHCSSKTRHAGVSRPRGSTRPGTTIISSAFYRDSRQIRCVSPGAEGGPYCPCEPSALPLSRKPGPRRKTLQFMRVQRESDATQTWPQCRGE